MVNEAYTFWIAVYGGLLSTGLLFWNIITYYLQNTPRLKVEVEYGQMFIMGGSAESMIMINVANVGKKPVTLSNFGFEFNKVDGADAVVFADMSLPKKLDEGESHSFKIEIENLKNNLKKQPQEAQMPKYAWVKDHAGKKHKSVNISKIPRVYNALKLTKS